ncbi:MAG TPA: ABC transporter substrate-binding protein [Syntrophorhabdales bacterium]|nr:ABC transporter substrate-binding protein [Syntrophorhabdales bacterium]
MARRRIVYVACLMLIVSSVALAASPQAAAPTKTVKVGVVSAHSGTIAFYGLSVLRTVELAVKDINERGTIGQGPGILVGNQRYKLEVVSYDDSADPAKSVAGMRRLAEMYKVAVVFGPQGTPNTWACQEINVGLNVLFVGMSASDLSRKKGNPLYIQERSPTLYFGDPMAQACIDRGFKKAAVLTDVNEAYQSWGKRFKEKFESLGGQIVGFETVDIKTITDYHSIMTSFKAKNPDIIFITMYEEPMALAATHALDVGYKGKFLFNSEWINKAEKILPLDRIEGSLVEAMLWTFYRKYHELDKRGFQTAYIKQYRAAYGDEPALTGPAIHDPVYYMMARAMELSGSVTDAKAIRAACPKALQEGKLPLIFPNNDVLKNGLMVGAPELLLEVKGGQYKLLQELRVPKSVLE